MFSCTSIWAVVLRYMLMLRHDLNFVLGTLYWPLLDIVTWGFLGSWIAQSQAVEFHNYESVALLGILLWQVVGRGCNIICLTFCEELWANNIVNLFSLPLRIGEWMCGIVLFNAIMMFIMSLICMLIVSLLYNISIWYIVSTFLIFLPPLFFSSIWIGFTCLSIVATLGRRAAELGFALAWLLLPFSGAYYPIEILPFWGQIISNYLPMSYIFQGMRKYVIYQQDPTIYLIKGYVLSICYAISAVIFFIYCFNRSKQKGLARLMH
ncbi:MAG TPA: ABC transporter permease [Candidatus Babeliales bacterium]|nr:ABC transporter permease [Candidatus Babeliales bacterium]